MFCTAIALPWHCYGNGFTNLHYIAFWLPQSIWPLTTRAYNAKKSNLILTLQDTMYQMKNKSISIHTYSLVGQCPRGHTNIQSYKPSRKAYCILIYWLFIDTEVQTQKSSILRKLITIQNIHQAYWDLEGPRDMTARKMFSDVPSTTPTAIIAGWSSHCCIYKRWISYTFQARKKRIRVSEGYPPFHENLHLWLLWIPVIL